MPAQEQPRDENGRFAGGSADARWVLYHLEKQMEGHQRAHEQRHEADQEALALGREAVGTLMEKQDERFGRELQTLRAELKSLDARLIAKLETRMAAIETAAAESKTVRELLIPKYDEAATKADLNEDRLDAIETMTGVLNEQKSDKRAMWGLALTVILEAGALGVLLIRSFI